jgi:hypothetical protein
MLNEVKMNIFLLDVHWSEVPGRDEVMESTNYSKHFRTTIQS